MAPEICVDRTAAASFYWRLWLRRIVFRLVISIKTPSLIKAGFLFALITHDECGLVSTFYAAPLLDFIKANQLNTDSNQFHGNLDIV
jgi:hypothetical protein